jgi:vesicle-fusing ATPase
MSDPQRTWANIGLRDMVKVQLYDPFSQGGQAYLGSADIEVSFASVKKRPQEPYDQDVLGREVIRVSYGYRKDLRDLLLTQPGFQ